MIITGNVQSILRYLPNTFTWKIEINIKIKEKIISKFIKKIKIKIKIFTISCAFANVESFYMEISIFYGG